MLGPWQYATGGLALALVLSLAWGARVDSLREGHKTAHEQTKRDYRAAQDKAQAAFDAQIAAIQSHNRRLNDDADKKVADATIVYRDRVIRLPTASAQCATGSGSVPQGGNATSLDGPGSDAIILARDDALICATNQARLEAAHDWAIGMR